MLAGSPGWFGAFELLPVAAVDLLGIVGEQAGVGGGPVARGVESWHSTPERAGTIAKPSPAATKPSMVAISVLSNAILPARRARR
jgi:hypothetical protein